MQGGIKIEGFENVMSNLHAEIAKIEGLSVLGLEMAASHIRYDMDKTPPLIPIHHNVLRQSWFAHAHKTFKGPGMVMGFSANYAVYVHEMIGAHFRRPGAGPKFFEAALRRNKQKILTILKENIKI